jgi:phosphoadenosine phosphosulfate reductase
MFGLTGTHHQGASEAIRWAAETYRDGLTVSTRFGPEAAVVLHMATSVSPNTTVIWIDGESIPTSTREYASILANAIGFKLHTVRPKLSRFQIEKKFGALWESSSVSSQRLLTMLEQTEPMMRALTSVGAKAVIAGSRVNNSISADRNSMLKWQHGVVKVCPLLGWSDVELLDYLFRHNLPLHPFLQQRENKVPVASSRIISNKPPTAARNGARRVMRTAETEESSSSNSNSNSRKAKANPTNGISNSQEQEIKNPNQQEPVFWRIVHLLKTWKPWP